MRLIIFLFIVMIVQSCSNGSQQKEPFKSLLAACDDVNINFYNGGDSVKFDTQDSLGIKVLTQSINGSTEPINDGCKPSGAVYYRAKGDTLFKAEFAVMPNDSKKECDYIVYSYQGKAYKNKLHDKAYQLLTQIYPKPSADTAMATPVDSTKL